jgi:hypothetical protein
MPNAEPDPDIATRFLLDFLVTSYPALFSEDELLQEFAGGEIDEDTRLLLSEGIADLAGAGLAHRMGDFVFASWSAMRARQLLP